jgi:hypothetical protein
MNSPEEDRLKTLFANLREEDQSNAPSFGKTVAHASVYSRRRFFLPIALAAVPVLAIAAFLALRTRSAGDAVPRELTTWSSPTAFLMETPGQQFLNQTPRLGVPLPALPPTEEAPK